MDSTNVEYLLKNYKVNDVIQIEKKLQNDVEKRKSDLKNLIGERFNELLEATDSIELMKSSVSSLIFSLKNLNSTLKNTKNIGKTSEDCCLKQNYYNITLSKILFDLPLQVWDSLQNENISLATYYYHYGSFIYTSLKKDQSVILKNKLHVFNESTFNDLKVHIVEYSWNYIMRKSLNDEIDNSKFADVFSCILILQNLDIHDLLYFFLSKQTENLIKCLKFDTKLSLLIHNILNIFENTIKTSQIFYEESNYEALIIQRYNRVTNIAFSDPNSPIDLSNIPEYFLNYKIANSLKSSNLSSLCYDVVKDLVLNWITSVKNETFSLLEDKFKTSSSIKEIFLELNETEKILSDKSQNWEEYNHIINIRNYVWENWIEKIFEIRINELANLTIDSIINEFTNFLPLCEKTLLHCDLNIAQFMWNETSLSKDNEFMILIAKSCEIVNKGFEVLKDDISVLTNNYQHILNNICKNVQNSFSTFKKYVDSYLNIKQFNLFGAVFFRKILESCPNLHMIFDLQQNSSHNFINWSTTESIIKSISDTYLCNWFDLTIFQHFENIDCNIFLDFNLFLNNLTFWESISLNEGNNENTNNSIIQVPMQLSLPIYNIIQCICVEINRYCTYKVPRTILVHILTMIGNNILTLYQSAIDKIKGDISFPSAAKQTISIQLYFDLFFFKNLFASIKDDDLRSNQLCTVHNLITLLETMIDPFDLHIIYPHIVNNSSKLMKSCNIIFGFLIDRKTMVADPTAESKQTFNHQLNEIKHNIMLIHPISKELTFSESIE